MIAGRTQGGMVYSKNPSSRNNGSKTYTQATAPPAIITADAM